MDDVLIVGGGVVGSLAALELRQRGCRVSLVDAAQSRPPASWAGGGILSPLFPWRYPMAVRRLCRGALEAYRALGSRILAAGGPDPEVLRSGMRVFARDAPEEILGWARQEGMEAREETEASRVLPGVPVWSLPGVGSVRNPRLMKGLEVLMEAEGIRRKTALIRSLTVRDGCVEVHLDEGIERAGRAVVCAGWWSGRLLAGAGIALDVFPVKGQMLLYRTEPDRLRHILLSEEGYLIPRADGTLLAGSTLEPGVEDQRPTRDAARHLARLAANLLPALEGVPPLAQWAGTRPGTSRAAPIIDRVDDGGRLWVSTGHYRNGLVAAPASGRLLAQRLCGETPEIDPAPYSFSSPGSSESF